MSDNIHPFDICSKILLKTLNRKTIQIKKGDIIIVPEHNCLISSLLTCNNRKSTDKINLIHNNVSNFPIYRNSFNSDIKSSLSIDLLI